MLNHTLTKSCSTTKAFLFGHSSIATKLLPETSSMTKCLYDLVSCSSTATSSPPNNLPVEKKKGLTFAASYHPPIFRKWKRPRLSSSLSSSFTTTTITSSPTFLPPRRSFSITSTLSSTAESPKTDYYELLGVAPNATLQDIKVGYIRMAKKYHPDANLGDSEAASKFQAMAEAFEVLSDEEKRGNYDTFGMDGQGTSGEKRQKKKNNEKRSGVFGDFVDEEEFQDFHDRVFSQFATEFHEAGIFYDPDVAREYGCSKHGNLPTKDATLELAFEEAVTGCSKKVALNVIEECPWCNGSGSSFKHGKQKCETCLGTGKASYLITGGLPVRGVCPKCKGDKFTFKSRCYECEGKGKILWRKIYSVPVPPGVFDEQTLEIRICESDVKMNLRVFESDSFTRDGADVGSHAAISIAQALLGGSQKVDSIYDDIPMDCLVAEQEETDATLEIPSGISSHEEICIKGKGMKKLDPIGKGGEEDCGGEEGGGAGAGAGGFGDHKVQIIIASPSSITERQRTLMERYAELEMGRDGTVNVRGGSLGQRSEPEDEDRGETEEVDQRDGQKLRNDGHDGHETEQKKGRLMN